jgi:SAM-dependent methyltransferase
VAGRHPQPGDPVVLGRLSQDRVPADNSQHYQGEAARWYSAFYAWKTDDIPFYQFQAERWAGPGGSVLELACGNGRVTLPMARAGHRVTAIDSSEAMIGDLRRRLQSEPDEVRSRVEPLRQDMRRFQLDRLFRFIYLPFNTLLLLAQAHEREAMLDRVREHLAPSGAFALEIFTPDPSALVDADDWVVDLEVEADDPGGEGRVHVVREMIRSMDLGRQLIHLRFRNRVSRGETTVATWEDQLDLTFIFPRELELILERQGFRIRDRFGSADGSAYAPTSGNIQPQFVVAQLIA